MPGGEIEDLIMNSGLRRKAVTLFTAVVVCLFSGRAMAGEANAQQWSTPTLSASDPHDVAEFPEVQLTRTYLPRAVDLSAKMPTPISQGEAGACLSYAIAYAAQGYYEGIRTGHRPGDPSITPSPAHMHTHSHLGEMSACLKNGGTMARALLYLRSHGNVSMSVAPKHDICTPRLAAAVVAPNQYSLRSARWVFSSTRRRRNAEGLHIARIKQELASGHPVLFSMKSYRRRSIFT